MSEKILNDQELVNSLNKLKERGVVVNFEKSKRYGCGNDNVEGAIQNKFMLLTMLKILI